MATPHQTTRLLLAYLRYRRSRASGFTLIELLVALLIATVVISSVLYVAVDLFQFEELDRSFTETEQDMEAALDFIVEDLREAVYVYDGDRIAEFESDPDQGIADNLGLTADDGQVVLAFWKTEPLTHEDCSDSDPCFDHIETGDLTCADGVTIDGANVASDEAAAIECRGLIQERATYTLVVYTQDTTPEIGKWDGPSTIVRHELRKYDPNSLKTTAILREPGYVDPRDESTFARWPYDDSGKSLQNATPVWVDDENKAVLVDYVDDPTAAAPGVPECAEDAPGEDNPDNYIRTPGDPAASTSFFACIRKLSNNNQQDVILYLRGNPEPRTAVGIGKLSLPSARTQVLIRGVVQKQVTN